MDAKLIIFIVFSGIVLVGLGSGLLAVYILYQEEFKQIRPAIVIGPVLLGGGVVTILCSGDPNLLIFILIIRPNSYSGGLCQAIQVKETSSRPRLGRSR